MNTQIRKPTFDLQVSAAVPSGEAMTATVTGEVDVMNAAEFARAIDDVAAPRGPILDLSRLRYLDSAGFAVVYRLLELRAVVVVITVDSPIRTAATLVGLPYHDSVGSAVSAL
jgi:anti-sigma B factor antagonist